MSDAPSPPPAGLPASAGSGTPKSLVYEGVPQQVQSVRIGDVIRMSIPVTPSTRRETWRWTATRIYTHFLVPIWACACGPLVLHLFVEPRLRWHSAVLLVPLAAVLATVVMATLGCVAGWVTSRMIRPVVLQLDANWLFASSPNRSGGKRWDRHRIRRVTVRPAGKWGIGQLHIMVGFDDRQLAVGTLSDLEFVAAELRAALGLLSPPNKAADGVGGLRPTDAAPPMPSAALWERP